VYTNKKNTVEKQFFSLLESHFLTIIRRMPMGITTLGTWRNPPLAYVVAELVISPHYSIGNAIPVIQDALRANYPRTVEATEILIDSSVAPTPSPAWRLLSADQMRGVQIGARAISLHAVTYSDSNDFKEHWKQVLSAVDRANLGAFVERAGLRYIDLMIPSDGKSTKDYLVPALQSVTSPSGAEIQHSMWISSYLIDDVTVQIRTAAPSPTGTLWPPNFNALPLKKPTILLAAEKALQEGQRIGFIDTDCQAEVQAIFDLANLAEAYTVLHQKMSETFEALISDLAREEWK
jgi:uncharacterized protein (TIGR04255 family)